MGPAYGVTIGARQLGLRGAPGDSDGEVRRVWQIGDCPRRWADANVAAIAGGSFKEVEILRRQGKGRAASWWFKALAPRDLDLLNATSKEPRPPDRCACRECRSEGHFHLSRLQIFLNRMTQI